MILVTSTLREVASLMVGRAIGSFGKALGDRRWKAFGAGLEGISKEKVDVVVIGAGVVGLAVAREMALKGRDVLVVESASTFGTGTSSRNSEVIHAGIYYPPNSLKVPW